MEWKRREVLLTALGALVAFCLTVLWAILVFAPEPVLGRVELRLAVCLCVVPEILYSWLRKKYLPERQISKAVKVAAAVMIAVVLLRLVWITFA